MKTCTKCGIRKKNEEFSRHAGKRDGLESWCKLCRSKYRQDISRRSSLAKDYERRRHEAEQNTFVFDYATPPSESATPMDELFQKYEELSVKVKSLERRVRELKNGGAVIHVVPLQEPRKLPFFQRLFGRIS